LHVASLSRRGRRSGRWLLKTGSPTDMPQQQ
jgi:hypothetical protein